jgi:hypothetical protein
MTEPERVPSTCDQCGQTDLAPKHHLTSFAEEDGIRTVHNDCLSYKEKEMAFRANPNNIDIITKCEEGLKNDDLLAYIQETYPEGSLGVEEESNG